MVFAYLGIEHTQEELARTLGMFADYGVPASHLLKFRSKRIRVVFETEGNINDLRHCLGRQEPVIAFVQTEFLNYWEAQVAQHAVLIVGAAEKLIYLLDPAKTEQVITVTTDEFLLAWDEMEFAYAVITRS